MKCIFIFIFKYPPAAIYVIIHMHRVLHKEALIIFNQRDIYTLTTQKKKQITNSFQAILFISVSQCLN